MPVPTRLALEKLAIQLLTNYEEFFEMLDQSELDNDGLRKARIYLVGVIDGMFEDAEIDADLAKKCYEIIGFSPEEMAASRHSAHFGLNKKGLAN